MAKIDNAISRFKHNKPRSVIIGSYSKSNRRPSENDSLPYIKENHEKTQRGYARQDRVKEQIMRELAELVRTGLKDPRAGFITINEVEVTRDYSHATVFYTVLDDSTRDITEEALEHAKGHLRSELAKRIKLFKTPELHFKYDESLERGMSISSLIDQVAAEKPVED